MKESYYFSHDYNARNDEKILKLIQKEGWLGYGLYWAIIEKLYEAGGFLEKDYECIAFDLRTECERIRAVIESGLFEFRNEKFYSKSVNARLIARKGKSEMARQSAYFRWNKPNKDDANALRTQSEGNAINKRKGKETKGKEREGTPAQQMKDFISNPERVISLLKEKGGDESIIRREIQKFISYWTESNKSGTKERWELQPTFDVSRRLGTWFSRIQDFNKKPKIVKIRE